LDHKKENNNEKEKKKPEMWINNQQSTNQCTSVMNGSVFNDFKFLQSEILQAVIKHNDNNNKKNHCQLSFT
jgi:hypothetical protein